MKILLALVLLFLSLQAKELTYSIEILPKKMSVHEKKKRFYALVLPETQKVYQALLTQHKKIKSDIKKKQNQEEISSLKLLYKTQTDEELLLALYPHPVSIALAQAAVESAWATSRFSREANNLFGMWSIKQDEERIAASEQREGKRTIWLKKFPSVEASIRAYYLTIARAKEYKEFRKLRSQSTNVYEMIKGLDKYSELGEEYVKIIRGVIRYNKLTKYD